MKELTCELEKQQESTVSKLYVNFYTYEIEKGLIFEYKLLNQFDFPVDAGQVIIGGSDWQNWPPASNDPQGQIDDENYILNKICSSLLLIRKTS